MNGHFIDYGDNVPRYKIDKILDARLKNDKVHFLIKWSDCNVTSWEPQENTDKCKEEIRKFIKSIFMKQIQFYVRKIMGFNSVGQYSLIGNKIHKKMMKDMGINSINTKTMIFHLKSINSILLRYLLNDTIIKKVMNKKNFCK